MNSHGAVIQTSTTSDLHAIPDLSHLVQLRGMLSCLIPPLQGAVVNINEHRLIHLTSRLSSHAHSLLQMSVCVLPSFNNYLNNTFNSNGTHKHKVHVFFSDPEYAIQYINNANI